MTASSVTLEEILRAAQSRRASLVPETSGYLALAIGDATSRLPFRVQERGVTLTTEGSVVVERGREVVPPTESARRLRDILGRLLDASVGSMPGLASAARARSESERGVDTVVEELEAALIPVNRAAARRALARLARETLRAKSQGKLRPRRARPSEEPPAEVVAQVVPAPPEPAVVQGSEPLEAVKAVEAGEAVEAVEAVEANEDVVIDVDLATPGPPAAIQATAHSDEPPPAEGSADDDLIILPEVEPTPTRFEATTFDDDHSFEPEPAADEGEPEPVAELPPPDATILDVETRDAPPGPLPSPEVDAVEALEVALLTGQSLGAPARPAKAALDSPIQGQAHLRPSRTSDVEELLGRFATSELSSGDVRQVRAELKIMIGLEPTEPPSAVALAAFPTDEMLTPTRLFHSKPVQIEGRKPTRAGRMGLVLASILVVLGLGLTIVIYMTFPAFFAGSGSSVANEQ